MFNVIIYYISRKIIKNYKNMIDIVYGMLISALLCVICICNKLDYFEIFIEQKHAILMLINILVFLYIYNKQLDRFF